jgi:hypothetical protein
LNQTLSIMRHEVKLMWKEFKLSAKKPLTRILIIGVIVAVTIVNLGLELIMTVFFDTSSALSEIIRSQLIRYGLTSSMIFDILYFLLLALLISSFVRGIISSSFGVLFTRTDENIIVPSPIAPHALYAAKKLKGFVLHALTVATILLAGFPFFIRVGFQGFGLAVLFITLLAVIEINGLIENVSYCVSRALFKRGTRVNKLALTAFIALTVFIVASPFLVVFGGASISFLTYLYPPYACSMILTLRPSFDVTLGVLSLLEEVILFFFAASAIAKIGLRIWASSPRLVQTRSNFIRLRKNRLMWKRGKKGSTRLMFMKDFWVTIRNPSKFFIPLGISLVLLFFVIGLQTELPFNMQQLATQQFTEAFFIPLVYLATVFILSPAWDSFASERRTLFILKSSPIKTSRIIWGKYLFALMRSATYAIPIVAAISFLFPHTLSIFLISLEVTLVLLVSNAISILASTNYPPAYRGTGSTPYLILLGLPVLCVALTMIIPISLLLFYRFPTLFGIISALMLSYVFFVVTSCLKEAESSFARLEEFHTDAK